MQELAESLSIEDISPILGNLQLTIMTQEKTIKRLREKVAELEARDSSPLKLDEAADADLRKMPVDGKR